MCACGRALDFYAIYGYDVDDTRYIGVRCMVNNFIFAMGGSGGLDGRDVSSRMPSVEPHEHSHNIYLYTNNHNILAFSP